MKLEMLDVLFLLLLWGIVLFSFTIWAFKLCPLPKTFVAILLRFFPGDLQSFAIFISLVLSAPIAYVHFNTRVPLSLLSFGSRLCPIICHYWSYQSFI